MPFESTLIGIYPERGFDKGDKLENYVVEEILSV